MCSEEETVVESIWILSRAATARSRQLSFLVVIAAGAPSIVWPV